MAEDQAKTRRCWLIVGGVILLLGVAGLRAYRPLAVAFHRWRMGTVLKKAYSAAPTARVTVRDQWWHPLSGTTARAARSYYMEQYQRSRDRLVALGYFEHREFYLEHIQVSTPESRRFWELVRDTFPDNVHTMMNWAGADNPEPGVLSVWARPQQMPEWERFVARHDVPDLLERFPAPDGGEGE